MGTRRRTVCCRGARYAAALGRVCSPSAIRHVPKMPASLRPTFALLLALAALAAVAPSSADAVKFGAWTPGSPFGGKVRTVNQLEHRLQRRVKIVNWFQDWSHDESHFTYNVIRAAKGVRRSGRIPMLTWEPIVPGPWEAYTNEAIANGAYDAQLHHWARRMAGLRSKLYLRFAHEFNGDWYAWGGPVNNNSPAEFKAMWRHVVDIFRAEGATNVKWVWSPLVDDPGYAPNFERYWPGAGYVDVMGLSGFNWGSTVPEWGGWRPFKEIFKKAYKRISRLSNKPVWITEIGSASQGGSKYKWVRQMFKTASKWDRLKAIVWYDQDKEKDWSTASAASAFKD